MKSLSLIFFGLLFGGCAFGQAEVGVPHEWTATVKTVDDNGQPVTGANVSVSYSLTVAESQQKGQEWDEIKGLTDKDGVFSASHSDSSWNLGIDINKLGYYRTYLHYELYVPGQVDAQTLATNRNPKLTLALKKIGHPIPMYARFVDSDPPVLGQPAGYDMVIGDWVAPYGKGQTTNIVFTKESDKKSPIDYDYKLAVAFRNQGDGVQVYITPEIDRGSALRSPNEAPLSGYQPELTRETSGHPGQPSKFEFDENRIYLFRTTLPDGPHYGKIYGDFMQFHFYLNPTPNDRNIEFDPGRNLLKLKSREIPVRAP